MANANIREAVGVFGDIASLRSAADTLMVSGFDRADLSVLASPRNVEDGLGHSYISVSELEDDPFVATRAYFGPDSLIEGATALIGVLLFAGAVAGAVPAIANDGDTGSIIFGTMIGAGVGGAIGGIGAYLAKRLYAGNLQAQLDHGGIPLWVRTTDGDHELKACEILRRESARDVHVHNRPALEETDAIYGFLHRLAGIPKPSAHRRKIIT